MIEQYIENMLKPYFTMLDQAINNFFTNFNSNNSTNFNCIFFEGRAYSSAKPGEPHRYITSEFADHVEEFRTVFNMEENLFHTQRKLNKYLVRLDRNSSFKDKIPKDWMPDYNSTPSNPDEYKKILGKDASDLEEIMQKCIVMRIMA